MKNGTLEEVAKQLRPRRVGEKRGGPRGKKATPPRQPVPQSEKPMSASMPEDSELRKKLEEAAKAGDVTALLQYWSTNETARNRVCELLLPRLREAARAQMRRESDKRMLQTDLLVSEAVQRLLPDHDGDERDDENRQVVWKDRVHFLRFAARVMSHVAVEYYRREQDTIKRGKGWKRIPLVENELPRADQHLEVVVVDDLLDELEKQHPEAAVVAMIHYFLGVSLEDIGDSLRKAGYTDMTDQKVRQSFKLAKAWFRRQFEEQS